MPHAHKERSQCLHAPLKIHTPIHRDDITEFSTNTHNPILTVQVIVTEGCSVVEGTAHIQAVALIWPVSEPVNGSEVNMAALNQAHVQPCSGSLTPVICYPGFLQGQT